MLVGRPTGQFAEFYRASYAGLVAQLYAMTGDFAGAEEAVQEAFGRAWARWEKVYSYADPRGWVLTVAHRLAISRWRKAQTALRLGHRHRSGQVVDEPSPDSVVLVGALARLPEAQRRALVLHYLADRPVAEIAHVDGVAEGTVKARLSRGRVALAALIGDAGGPPTDAGAPVGHERGRA
jgi:RNA polymerase sigma-70 factor (ECF subfamily)